MHFELETATSNTRTAALNKLKNVQFNPPDVLITGDDVRNGKPPPEGYLMAASTIGVAPENCVVVEDSPVGIEAGKSAGMYIIVVETTHGESFLRNADVIVDDLYDMCIAEVPA
ncbi:MAG: HAD-IA family hydrolase [bacterium]|nr:HAD-IA family hydrolase [bacterium]MDT8365149.1 HAD-IA family hydrolase [bacterium]